MGSINKAILVGWIGKDPEVRALDNGVKVARFSIATTESYKDRNTGERVDTTEWHSVTVWRGLAEVAEKYLKKGSQVYIEGKIQTRKYTDDSGVDKYSTGITANIMTMLGKSSGDGSNQGGQNNDYGQPQGVAPAGSGSDLDDLPF